MTMRSAVLREYGGKLQIEEVAAAELQDDEVLVRIAGVGICHTDLTAIKGDVPLPLPTVLGHEGAGVVEAVGPDVSDLVVGDHVVLTFNHCGECDVCASGHPAYCVLFGALNYFGTRLDGTTTMRSNGADLHGSWFGQSSFGTHAIANVRNAVKVDPTLPIALLGPLGCGLLTGAGTVLNVLQARSGQSIGVWGAGTVGLAAVMAARLAGCETILAVDVNPARLELARELGATHVLDPNQHADVVWEVLELTGGLDHAIETVGLGTVVRDALASLKSPGTCVTLGLQTLENEITIDQGHLLIGRTLTGVIEGDADPHTLIPQLAELWREGKFPFDRLVETFPFDKIGDALDAFRRGAVVKPVLVFDYEA